MSEGRLREWIEINAMMDDDYRKEVVSISIEHIQNAPQGLRSIARNAINEGVFVPGFRSSDKAPKNLLLASMEQEMQSNPEVARIVIALWADQKSKTIDDLAQYANKHGFSLETGWGWDKGIHGWVDYEDVDVLAELIDGEDFDEYPKLDRDHLKLALYWLSSQFAPAEEVRGHRQVLVEGDSVMDRIVNETKKKPEPILELIEPDLTLEIIEPEADLSLDQIKADLTFHINQCDRGLSSTISMGQKVLVALKHADTENAANRNNKFQNLFKELVEQEDGLKGACHLVSQFIVRELQDRPDMGFDFAHEGDTVPELTTFAETKEWGAELLARLEEIEGYEKEKQELLAQYDQFKECTNSLRRRAETWGAGWESTSDGPTYSLIDLRTTNLAELKELVDLARQQNQMLEEELDALRFASIDRLLAISKAIIELSYADDVEIVGATTVKELSSDELLNLSPDNLIQIENKLLEIQASQPSASLSDLAIVYKEERSSENLLELLEELARNSRDIENLLLFLARDKGTFTNRDKISSAVLMSLLRAFDKASRPRGPYNAVSLFVMEFLNEWEPESDVAKARIYLACLIAHLSPIYPLSVGHLYQLGMKWPIEEMKNWGTLWAYVLQGQEFAVTSIELEEERRVGLVQKRQAAEDPLKRDKGVYVRVQGIKSNRHRELMGQEIMPSFDDHLKKIQSIHDRFDNNSKKLTKKVLKNLQAIHSVLVDLNNDKAIADFYEKSAHVAGVADEDVFHRRACLRLMNSCTKTLYEYVDDVYAVSKQMETSKNIIVFDDLQKELERTPELKVLGSQVLGLLKSHRSLRAPTELPSDLATLQDVCIAGIVLKDPHFSSQNPQLVSFLLSNRFELPVVGEKILDDLISVMSLDDAIQNLLAFDGTVQLAALHDQLDTEQIKELQRIETERKATIHKIKLELTKNGVSIPGIEQDEILGRWSLVDAALSDLLRDQEQGIFEPKDKPPSRDSLRERINALDTKVFKMEKEISESVLKAIEDGLEIARACSRVPRAHSSVEAFLDDLEYRIAHDAWSEGELVHGTDVLRKCLDDQAPEEPKELSIEEIRDLLETNNLRSLGISEGDLSHSEAETRWHVADAYLRLKEAQGFLSKDFDQTIVGAHNELYSYFGRMHSLNRGLDPQGKILAWDAPIVFSSWKLRYPKTNVLDELCRLLCLPGVSLRSKDIKEFQNMIEEKEWLEYGFVILFAPSITEKVRKRFENAYRNQGLVIIDEPTMISLLLAEREQKKPIGQLRSLMLNALGAQHVDIFKFNQLVNPRSSIFVGRDHLVHRLTTTGENYVLYGGRRIGKSSVLSAVNDQLRNRNIETIYHSFEGETDCSDDATASTIAQRMDLETDIGGVSDFKTAIQELLDSDKKRRIVFLLDEIDRYTHENPERHAFIETLRSISEAYSERFRVIAAGYIDLYECMRGRGPYSPTSDPWQRMFNDLGPLANLRALSAESIVNEGFREILGWSYESRSIPRLIVERTGGHPAFVQHFCSKLQERVAKRQDRRILAEDIDAVFDDTDPEQSFIAFVRRTLQLNLDPVARFLLLWIAQDASDSYGFSREQLNEVAGLASTTISQKQIDNAIERLVVTSVVDEKERGWYVFSVPDYPRILERLGDTEHLDEVERLIAEQSGIKE